MKEYNYFQAFYKSFYSKALYRDVAKNWGANVIIYLFLMLLVCMVAIMGKYQPVIKYFEMSILPQLPTIEIHGGEMKTAEDKTYEIKDPDSKEVIAIIDTSSKYDNAFITEINNNIVITKTRMYFKDDVGRVQYKTYPSEMNATFSPSSLQEKMAQNRVLIWLALLCTLLFSQFIYRLFLAIGYAIIGKILAFTTKVHLRFSQVFKVTVVAMTPAMVVGFAMSYLNIFPYIQSVLYFVLTIGYLNFALQANKETK